MRRQWAAEGFREGFAFRGLRPSEPCARHGRHLGGASPPEDQVDETPSETQGDRSRGRR
jgi:hypothetical protein